MELLGLNDLSIACDLQVMEGILQREHHEKLALKAKTVLLSRPFGIYFSMLLIDLGFHDIFEILDIILLYRYQAIGLDQIINPPNPIFKPQN